MVSDLLQVALGGRAEAALRSAAPTRFGASPGLVAVWNVRLPCNQRCPHCYIVAARAPAPGDLHTAARLQWLDRLADGGVRAVIFSGGESLLRGDLVELVAHATRRGIHPQLSLNGTLLDAPLAERLHAAGPALAGIPVTFRGIADRFAVLTAHRRGECGGFSLPSFQPTMTLVLLMGVSTVAQWRRELLEKGHPAELPVAFVTEASTERQQVLVTTLECAERDAAAQNVASPSVAVVGEVVRLRARLNREAASGPEQVGDRPGALDAVHAIA